LISHTFVISSKLIEFVIFHEKSNFGEKKMKNKKYHNVRGQIDKKKKAVPLEIQNYML
jgi:hypothetical protein